ncbi:hypothetical protein CRG98_014971 [Punica granatum]|uniref:Uncharacterized protein n=1 Tax=Punica granatum TaxID=22663 RepID=A0A2I0K952_PUNGR|nr:hypothetical protein CRG98_014971 [Punica granatum]
MGTRNTTRVSRSLLMSYEGPNNLSRAVPARVSGKEGYADKTCACTGCPSLPVTQSVSTILTLRNGDEDEGKESRDMRECGWSLYVRVFSGRVRVMEVMEMLGNGRPREISERAAEARVVGDGRRMEKKPMMEIDGAT